MGRGEETVGEEGQDGGEGGGAGRVCGCWWAVGFAEAMVEV
jgi:hypothetical protein